MNYHLYPYQSVFPQEIPRPGTENEDACFWEDDGSYGLMSDDSGAYQGQEEPHPVIRVVKKNKKERRRTQSINNAFSDLRECIPNVPFDTKLSKIKTLRLATSYIGYLMGVLENDDYGDGFKADLSSQPRKSPNYQSNRDETKKNKGRTGWPQHVWALELKQESV